jgi:hypothetical protein
MDYEYTPIRSGNKTILTLANQVHHVDIKHRGIRKLVIVRVEKGK